MQPARLLSTLLVRLSSLHRYLSAVLFLPARRQASAILVMSVCPSVRHKGYQDTSAALPKCSNSTLPNRLGSNVSVTRRYCIETAAVHGFGQPNFWCKDFLNTAFFRKFEYLQNKGAFVRNFVPNSGRRKISPNENRQRIVELRKMASELISQMHLAKSAADKHDSSNACYNDY